MPHYEWRGDGPFHDNRNNRVLEHGDVVELPERVAGNHDFVEVEAPSSGDEPQGSDAEDTGAEYTREELEDMEWQELRTLAADAVSDAVSGKSSRDEIIEFFAGE